MKVSTTPDRKQERRREAWVFAAIAVLIILNVAIYLRHHWNLTGANEARTQRPVAPRVIVD